MKQAFIDIETTGLDPMRHEIWEVAYILYNNKSGSEERTFKLPVDLVDADAKALQIGHFYERHNPETVESSAGARAQILSDLDGAILVGNNVSFDARFLEQFLGSTPWHYHVVDVKALVAGKLGLIPPWDTEDLLKLAGLPTEKKHEALADCRQALDLYRFALSPRRASPRRAATFEALGVTAKKDYWPTTNNQCA